MKVAVIFPAAGAGRRFFESQPQAADSGSKIEELLAGKAVFLRAIEVFRKRPEVGQMLLAVAPDRVEHFKLRYGDRLGFYGVQVVAGGTQERWETVMKALAEVQDDCTHVAVHDAARPLTSDALVQRTFQAAEQYNAVIPGHAVSATLKRVADISQAEQPTDPLDAILGDSGAPSADKPTVRQVVETVDRANVVEVQTPQVFERQLLQEAYDAMAAGKFAGLTVTDDAGLIEAMGETVYTVEGEATNLKITRPADLELAELIAGARQSEEAASLGAKRLFLHDDED